MSAPSHERFARAGLDAGGRELVAGEVNAHTHLYSALAPFGMPPPREAPASFVEILERVWWRLDRALDERSLAASARWYAAEALLAGTTALIDHLEAPNAIEGSLDVVADACEALGVRALVCYGASERNGGRDEARRGLAECRRFHLANRRELVRGAVGLHASFTVSDETVREAGALARELGLVLHVHVAEDACDVEDARRRGYAGVIDRLERLGALVPGSNLAHGVHLTADEVRRTADLGCWLVQNPRSNAANRVGYPRTLGASSRVALGTDGFRADMREEERALRMQCALHGEDERRAADRALGSRALAAELFGPDAAEDVVARDEDGRARHVLVGDRAVMRDGALTGASLDSLRADAEREAAALWRRMAAL
jgi:cytosine/adenosine deaminase-related metal-dependent hydrolase